MLGGGETGGLKLARQSDKRGHQHDMQAHNAEIELKEFWLGKNFAEAAFHHTGLAVQHVILAVRHHP